MLRGLTPPRSYWDSGTPHRLASVVEKEVEAIWTAERAARPGLFNGEIFAVSDLEADRLTGHFVEYRLFIAQWRKPALYEDLRLETLSVSGLLLTSGGVVWGQRSAEVTQNPLAWELVPSGGVDRSARTADGSLDLRGQAMAELREEVGMPAEAIREIGELMLMHDAQRHMYDLGMQMRTDWPEAEIIRCHAGTRSREHVELRVVPQGELEDYLAGQPGELAGLSRLLLQSAKLAG